MSRKAWLGVGIAALVLVAMGAAGAVGYLAYDRNRIAEWHSKAEAEYKAGNWSMAKNWYGLYLSKHPEDGKALLAYADAASKIPENRTGSLEGAATAYHQYLEQNPNDREVQEKLLDLYVQLGSWLDVQNMAELFLNERPDDPTLLYYRALGLDHAGSDEQAVEAYRDLIRRNTDRADVYGNLARQLQEQGLRSEADEVVAQGTTARPDDVAMRLMAHAYYRESGSDSLAQRELSEAVRLAPEDARVLLAQTEAALRMQKPQEAAALGEKAYAADPKSARAGVVLARAYAGTGNVEKAAEVLSKMPRLVRADSPDAMVLLADLLFSLSRVDEAKQIVQEYAKAFPRQQPLIEYFRAREMLIKGDSAGARDTLTLVVEKQPAFTPAQFFLAVAQLGAGDRNSARTTLDGYLRQNPNDQRARMLYETEFQPPRPDQAVEAVQAAIQSDNASSNDLVNAARVLVNSMESSGQRNPEQLATLRRVMEEAIRRDPKSPEPYQGLVDVLLGGGDLAAAREALQKAREAGVQDEKLYLAQAHIALEEKNTDKARELFDADFAQTTTQAQTLKEWVDFFAAKSQPALAHHALERGAEKLGDDNKPGLAVRGAEIAAMLEEPAPALEAIRKARASVQQLEKEEQAPLLDRLRTAQTEVARGILSAQREKGVEEAQAILTEVRNEDPGNPSAAALEGQILLMQEPPKVDEARALFEKALEADAANAVALLGLSEIESKEGNIARALELADRASSAAPRSVMAAIHHARLRVASGDYLHAQAVLEPILKSQPDNLEALELYIQSLLGNEQTQQAEAYLKQFEARAGQKAEAAGKLAELRAKLLVAQNSAPEAADLLRKQHEANPDDYRLLVSYADVLQSTKQWDEAERLYTDYLARHADDVQGWIDLARLYLATGRNDQLDDASNALTRALIKRPNDPQATREMIGLHIRRGNTAEALGWCDRYLRREPNDPEVLYRRAALLSNLPGRLPEALESVEHAVNVSQEPQYMALRGLIYLNMKEFAKALQDLQQVANGPAPTTAQVDLALAQLYLITQKNDLAQRYYESARQKAEGGQPIDVRKLQEVGRQLHAEGGTT